MTHTPNPSGVSVPVAIVIGLFSSFVQSLGLTIQRKSHMQNALLPEEQQRKEWRRKSWIAGFAIFLLANIGGTVFQIGALPIVMLAPLGAVSLLFNALLARFLLDDFFSSYMLSGTGLIIVGAVLIGYFGVVNESPHSLDELLALYARPAFVAFASIFFVAFVGILAIAHLAEWQLHVRLFRPSDVEATRPRKSSSRKRKKFLPRRWSAPTLAPVAEVSESSSGIATPSLEIADEAARRGIPVERLLMQRGPHVLAQSTKLKSKTRNYGSTAPSRSFSADDTAVLDGSVGEATHSTSEAALAAAQHDPAVRKICLGLAITYGGASGTLSGACLLLAKSGVELLVLTIGGNNQFDRWQSWFLVAVMLLAALLQLWYLNKSLRLASPPLVCPLAFCFYNTSSIALGLVYFNQVGSLSVTSILAVILGTFVLLAGVWIVSLHGAPHGGENKEDGAGESESLLGEHTSQSFVASPSDLLRSPSSSSDNLTSATDTEQTEALLANAAGIGGPHLPPPNSALAISPPSESTSSSPSTTANGDTGAPSNVRHRRTRSAHASLMGGLGLHIPGLPTQSAPLTPPPGQARHSRTISTPGSRAEANSAIRSPPTNAIDPVERQSTRRRNSLSSSSSAAGSRSSLTPQLSLLTSPKTRRRGLYESLMERGLSIGLSPSSPGFHVGSTFEVDTGHQESTVRPGNESPSSPHAPQHRLRERLRGSPRSSYSQTLPHSVITSQPDNQAPS